MKLFFSLTVAALALSVTLPAHADLRSRCIAAYRDQAGFTNREAKKMCKCMIRVVDSGVDVDSATEHCYSRLLNGRL